MRNNSIHPADDHAGDLFVLENEDDKEIVRHQVSIRNSSSYTESSPLSDLMMKLNKNPDEEMLLLLIDEGIQIILDMTKSPIFSREEIKRYFNGIFQSLPSASDHILTKLSTDFPIKLFCKSSFAFEIFLSYFFSSNISDNTGLKLFNLIIANPTLHESIQNADDLNSIYAIIVTYFEGGNTISDKSLSASFSSFIRNSFPKTTLFDLFSRIKFHLSIADFHLAPLYYEFLVNAPLSDRINFIHILVDVRALHHFDSIPPKNILRVWSQISIRTTKDCFGNTVIHPAFTSANLSAKGHPLEYHSLNSKFTELFYSTSNSRNYEFPNYSL
jgi:hypothetical protein